METIIIYCANKTQTLNIMRIKIQHESFVDFYNNIAKRQKKKIKNAQYKPKALWGVMRDEYSCPKNYSDIPYIIDNGEGIHSPSQIASQIAD